MATADEYRAFAEEGLRWARAAKTDDERKAFLDIARTWTQAAGAPLPSVDVVDRNECGGQVASLTEH